MNVATGTVAFAGNESFHGGTGRFADAEGSASTTGSASLVTNTGQFTVEGTSSY